MEQVAVRQARAEREAGGRPVADKRMTAEAATALIRDGDHVAIGGTLYSRTPMALVFALLRQRRRHLTVSRTLACYEIELFLATGALDRIVTSWVGIGLPWGLPPIFRHYAESGQVRYDEWSHLAMGLRYKAGAMGVPFLPSLTMLGSDLAAHAGPADGDLPVHRGASWPRCPRSTRMWPSSTRTGPTCSATCRSTGTGTWTPTWPRRPAR